MKRIDQDLPFANARHVQTAGNARGLEHVPETGGALVVANHSGTIAVDSVMTSLALLDHHPAHRHLRMLGADLVFRTPGLGAMAAMRIEDGTVVDLCVEPLGEYGVKNTEAVR